LTLQIDCDVLQADGGTRTASVNGAYIAAAIAVSEALAAGRMKRSPLLQALGAVSVGIVGGQVCLDLDYEEDSRADVDLNVVLAESGAILELQGTSESSGGLFGRASLNEMLDVATRGIDEIFGEQRRVLEEWTASAGAGRRSFT
jgi:ribonuclease PH